MTKWLSCFPSFSKALSSFPNSLPSSQPLPPHRDIGMETKLSVMESEMCLKDTTAHCVVFSISSVRVCRHSNSKFLFIPSQERWSLFLVLCQATFGSLTSVCHCRNLTALPDLFLEQWPKILSFLNSNPKTSLSYLPHGQEVFSTGPARCMRKKPGKRFKLTLVVVPTPAERECQDPNVAVHQHLARRWHLVTTILEHWGPHRYNDQLAGAACKAGWESRGNSARLFPNEVTALFLQNHLLKCDITPDCQENQAIYQLHRCVTQVPASLSG